MKRDPHSVMDRARFGVLLDAYGADPQRWPVEERAAALAFVEHDASARLLLEDAARLDAVLDVDTDAAPSSALVARILADAPVSAPANVTPLRPVRRLRQRTGLAGQSRLRYLAAAVPLAAAAAVMLWLLQSRNPTQPPVAVPLAALGTYATPGDELLAVSEIDFFGSDPWADCPDSVLGCLEADDDAGDPMSNSTNETRNFS